MYLVAGYGKNGAETSVLVSFVIRTAVYFVY
jgi:hypothetical protein